MFVESSMLSLELFVPFLDIWSSVTGLYHNLLISYQFSCRWIFGLSPVWDNRNKAPVTVLILCVGQHVCEFS